MWFMHHGIMVFSNVQQCHDSMPPSCIVSFVLLVLFYLLVLLLDIMIVLLSFSWLLNVMSHSMHVDHDLFASKITLLRWQQHCQTQTLVPHGAFHSVGSDTHVCCGNETVMTMKNAL